MRALRRTWPLASILFVTLAGAEIASAEKTSSTAPTATTVQARPVSLRLLGRTWCLGQPPATTCDVRLPLVTAPREAAATPAAAPASADGPFHRVLRRMKELFGGTQPTAARG